MSEKLKKSISLLTLISALMLSIVGCASLTSAPVLTSSATTLPTPAIESEPTSTETPLSSSGSWLVFINDNQLFAVNKDGTGLTSLAPELSVWQATSSPKGNIVAILASKNNKLSYTVTLLDVPQGNILHQIPLLSFYDKEPASFDDGPKGPLTGILGSDPISGIKWSPDGRYLAFMGAIENPSSSLHIYDSKSQSTRRLSQSKYQAVNPNWSPDGKWIVYEEVSDFHGWQTKGIWASSVDDNAVKLLYTPTNHIEQKILGWIENNRFLVADRGVDGERNIRIVDITTGNVTAFYSGYYLTASIGDNGAVAFFPITGAPGAGAKLERALYLISPDNPDPKLISKIENSFNTSLTWNATTKLFTSEIRCDNEPEKIVAFDSSGKTMCIAKPKTNVSPDGTWYIVENEQLNIYQADGEKLGEFTGISKQIIWSPDSGGFFLVRGNELQYVSLPSMISQNVYESKNGYFSFLWVGAP